MGESTRNAGGRFAKKKKGRGGESAPVMPRREGKMARTRSCASGREAGRCARPR